MFLFWLLCDLCWSLLIDGLLFVTVSVVVSVFFFFKQKTAYEMRISDWSSDVCSSDLLLTLARELGINLIDTAPAYGVSEERLGPLLAGQRDEWVIVSKVGEEFENSQSRFDFSATHTRFSVERSLKRLRTDRIELVLVHSDGNDLDILQHAEVYQTLAELKREGKILGYGLSGNTVDGGLLALQQGGIGRA